MFTQGHEARKSQYFSSLCCQQCHDAGWETLHWPLQDCPSSNQSWETFFASWYPIVPSCPAGAGLQAWGCVCTGSCAISRSKSIFSSVGRFGHLPDICQMPHMQVGWLNWLCYMWHWILEADLFRTHRGFCTLNFFAAIQFALIIHICIVVEYTLYTSSNFHCSAVWCSCLELQSDEEVITDYLYGQTQKQLSATIDLSNQQCLSNQVQQDPHLSCCPDWRDRVIKPNYLCLCALFPLLL